MYDIKSYSQLKEIKKLKKEQLVYMKVKLYADYYQLIYATEKIKNGFDWWKKIIFGIQVFKQVKDIFRHFKHRRAE